MKKLHIILVLCCLITTSIYAQNVTQERNINSFSGIKVCCGIDLYLSEGTSSILKITANPDVIDRVLTEVKGGVLNVSVKNDPDRRFNNNQGGIKVYVSANNLNLIEASSGSDIKGQTKINAKEIKLSASSSGDITLDLYATHIIGNASSGSDIKVTGSATSAKLSASSGSDIKMKGMSVLIADVKASSGSDIEITVKEEINAKASSGSDIEYYGNPTRVNVSSSSGGSIKRKSH